MPGRSVEEADAALAAAAAQSNRGVNLHRGSSRRYGLQPIELPGYVDVGKLAAAVSQGFEGGRKAKGTTASCVWPCEEEGPRKGRQIKGFGFEDYGNVHGQHVKKEQKKHNCVIDILTGTLATTMLFCHVLPGLADVMDFCLTVRPDLEIVYMHLIEQASVQLRYGWHRDNDAGKGYGEVEFTFVFVLSTEPGLVTSMQVGGREEYRYPGPGHGVLFRSVMLHRSVLSGGAKKLVLFMRSKPKPP